MTKEIQQRQPVNRDDFYGEGAGSLRREIFTQNKTHVDVAQQKTLEEELVQYQQRAELAAQVQENILFHEMDAISQLLSIPKTVLERDREKAVKKLHDIITAPTKDEELGHEAYEAIRLWVEKINLGSNGKGKLEGAGKDQWSVYQPESYTLPEELTRYYDEEAQLALAKGVEELINSNKKIKAVEKDIQQVTKKVSDTALAMGDEGKTGLLDVLKKDVEVGAYIQNAETLASLEAILSLSINEVRSKATLLQGLDVLDKLQCDGKPPKLSELTDQELKLVAPIVLGSAYVNPLPGKHPLNYANVTTLDLQEYGKKPRIDIESDLYQVLEARGFKLSAEAIGYLKLSRGQSEMALMGDIDFRSKNEAELLLVSVPVDDREKYTQRINDQHQEIKSTLKDCETIVEGYDQRYVNAVIENLQSEPDELLGYGAQERLYNVIQVAKRNNNVVIDLSKANLDGLDFSELDFTGVKVTVTPDQLKKVQGLDKVQGLEAEVVSKAIEKQLYEKHITPLKQAESCLKSTEVLKKILTQKESGQQVPLTIEEKRIVFPALIAKYGAKEALVGGSDVEIYIGNEKLGDNYQSFIGSGDYGIAQTTVSDENIEGAFDTLVSSFDATDIRMSLTDLYSNAEGNATAFLEKYSTRPGITPKDVTLGREIQSISRENMIDLKNTLFPVGLQLVASSKQKVNALEEHIDPIREMVREWGDTVRNQTLKEVQVKNVDLSGLDLSGKDLSGVDFTGTSFNGATLDGANLEGAKVSSGQLKGVKGILKVDFGWEEISLDGNAPQKAKPSKGIEIKGLEDETLQEAKKLKLDDLSQEVVAQRTALEKFNKRVPQHARKEFKTVTEQLTKNLDTMERAIKRLHTKNREHDALDGSDSLIKALEVNSKALDILDKAEKAKMGAKGKTDTTLLKSSESTAKYAGQYAENANEGIDKIIAMKAEKKPNIFQRFGNWVSKKFEAKPVEDPLTREEQLQKNFSDTVQVTSSLVESGLLKRKDAVKVVENEAKHHLEQSEQVQDAFIKQPKAAKVMLGVSEDDRRQLHSLREELDKYPPEVKQEKIKEARSFFGSIKKAFGIAGTSEAKDSGKTAKKHDAGISDEKHKAQKTIEIE